ncbi:MAG: hypothetical protein ACYSR5_07740 [Planctomycetota bacterium]|jgi:hypothetical protein
MDANVLTISSMFGANGYAGPTSQRPPATQNTGRLEQNPFRDTPQNTGHTPAPTGGVTSANASEAATTDNKPAIAQNKPGEKPPENFIDDFHKKIAVEKPKEIQPQVKSQEQGSDSGVAVQPNIVQSWLAWRAAKKDSSVRWSQKPDINLPN